MLSKESDGLASEEYPEQKSEEKSVADDLSENCLEHFYDNKIFFPGFVRPLK